MPVVVGIEAWAGRWEWVQGFRGGGQEDVVGRGVRGGVACSRPVGLGPSHDQRRSWQEGRRWRRGLGIGGGGSFGLRGEMEEGVRERG